MELIKGKILTSHEVLYTKFCKSNDKKLLLCKKDAFQNTDFFSLKCQFKRKKKSIQANNRLDFHRSLGFGIVEERRLISRTAARNRAYFLKISQVPADEEIR